MTGAVAGGTLADELVTCKRNRRLVRAGFSALRNVTAHYGVVRGDEDTVR
jgi:hypothetical protein